MKFKMPKIRRVDIERMLILCSAALVVALALKGQEDKKLLYEEVEQVRVAQDVILEENQMPCSVFYENGEGYLVPVTVTVDKSKGVAKEAVKCLIASGENDLNAAKMGLKTTVPEGTEIDLDIQEGRARIDLKGGFHLCNDAVEENRMISSIEHTLCAFPTIQEVNFLFDGQKRSRLTNGTNVSQVFKGECINLESVSTSASAGDTVNTIQLYFPSSTGRMLVPVTRTVYSDKDVLTAMVELLKGPKKDSGLMSSLPKNCAVKKVTVKNGVATVDFSKQFLSVLEDENSMQTIRSVLFTASQFPGIKEVQITVEGEKIKKEKQTASVFLNAQNDIVNYYPGVMEIE